MSLGQLLSITVQISILFVLFTAWKAEGEDNQGTAGGKATEAGSACEAVQGSVWKNRREGKCSSHFFLFSVSCRPTLGLFGDDPTDV